MQDDQDALEVSGSVLALDVGATFIKSGLVGQAGTCRAFPPRPVDSGGTATEVMAAIAGAIRAGMRGGCLPHGVGVSIPGPFDYARGVSLMTHKYKALHGMDLGEALRREIPALQTVPIWFRHDVNAFLAGELWLGAARGLHCALGVMLGTGIGVSCYRDGGFLTNELGAPAPGVSVWNKPYRDGIVEDYVSSRGLLMRYRADVPDYAEKLGVKGIADAAQRGEPRARRVFEDLGTDLGRILTPVWDLYRPGRIVFGGQVSKAFPLFREALVDAMPNPPCVPCALGDAAGLVGIAALHFMPTLWKVSPVQPSGERNQP